MPATIAPDPHTSVEARGSFPADPIPHAPTEQEKFDAEVNRDIGIVARVLGAAGIVVALGLATVALVVASHGQTTTVVMRSAPVATTPVTPVAPATPVTPAIHSISFSVAGSVKKGPDGKMHDAYSKTNFAVKVGVPTHLVIDNKDSGPHSITAPGTGISITVYPGIHTYTMLATKAGRFEWTCVIPCDTAAHGWAMTHPGYMAGYIVAT